MLARLRPFLPELGIAALLVFFAVRELGTFPAPWVDEGLFVIVAKSLAMGHGYALPLLETQWHYPYFLNVGPTFILPVALSFKLFGISSEAARLPMVLWLLGCTLLFYTLTERLLSRLHARSATLLLVTFSAFINTGKPVLGEIPAFFFLLLGFWFLMGSGKTRRGVWSGIAFGLAIVTKITFGLILPSLAVAWARALWRQDREEAWTLFWNGLIAFALFIAWRSVEITHTLGGSLTEEFHNFMFGGGDSALLYVIRFNAGILLRLPYLAYGVFLLLGAIGLWQLRGRTSTTVLLACAMFIGLDTLYFLNGFGWYRLLLPAHLLLLPFVPMGAITLCGRRGATVLLAAIVAMQAYWQWDHQGSNPSTEGLEAVRIIQHDYAQKDLIIEQPEIFSQLPENPHWLFLMPRISFSIPARFITVSGDDCKKPIVRKLSQEEQQAASGLHLQSLAGRYFLISPPYPCPYTAR